MTRVEWPALGSTTVPWQPVEGLFDLSRRALRSTPTTYAAAIVPPIATVPLVLGGDLAADLDDATRLLAAFDAGGAGEIAPFASVLLRSEAKGAISPAPPATNAAQTPGRVVEVGRHQGASGRLDDPPGGIGAQGDLAVGARIDRVAPDGVDGLAQTGGPEEVEADMAPLPRDVVDADHRPARMGASHRQHAVLGVGEHLRRPRGMQLGQARADPRQVREALEDPAGTGAGVAARGRLGPVDALAVRPAVVVRVAGLVGPVGSLGRPSSSPLHTTGMPPHPATIACARKSRARAAPSASASGASDSPTRAAAVPLMRLSPVAALC